MSDKKVIKYVVEKLNDRAGYASFCRVDIPKGGKVLDVSYIGGDVMIDVIVNPEHKKKERWFAVFEEGMPMEDYEKKTFEYIGKLNVTPTLYIFEVHD